jgi:hypothetical protein
MNACGESAVPARVVTVILTLPAWVAGGASAVIWA